MKKEKITIGEAGKIQIPQKILKEIGFKEGDPVEFDVEEFHFDDPSDDYPAIVIKRDQDKNSESITKIDIEAIRKKKRIGEYLEKHFADGQDKHLAFIDGVLLTWKIFDGIIQKRLTDENGKPEKDSDGYSYIGIIDDDITNLLFCEVLFNYYEIRGYQLINQFGINI